MASNGIAIQILVGTLTSFAPNLLAAIARSLAPHSSENARLLAAIRKTSREYTNLNDLAQTLREWADRGQVAEMLGRFTRGEIQAPAAEFVAELYATGFYCGDPPDDTVAAGVLSSLFKNLRSEILRSPEGTEYAFGQEYPVIVDTHTVVTETRTEIESLSAALRASGITLTGSEAGIPDAYVPIRDLVERRQFKAAVTLLDRLRDNFGPGTTTVQRYFNFSFRGWVALHQQRLPEALEMFSAARDLMPKRMQAIRNVGLLLLMTGKYDEAMTAAEEIIKLAPDEPDAILFAAQAMKPSKGIDAAIAYLDGTRVPDAQRDFVKGFLYHAAAQWRLALVHLNLARLANPDRIDVLLTICSATAALIGEEVSLGKEPPWVVCWNEKETLIAAMESSDLAVNLSESFESCPERASALSFAATYSSYMGRKGSAVKYLRLVSALLDHSDQSTLCRIIQAEAHLGMIPEARQHAALLVERADPTDERMLAWAQQILDPDLPNVDTREIPAEAAGESHLKPETPTWIRKWEEARDAIRETRWTEASQLLAEIISPFAPRRFIQYYLASLFNSGSFKPVMEFISLLKEYSECGAEFYDIEITVWEVTGDLPRALATALAAETATGASPHWRLRRAEIALRMGERQEAIDALPTLSAMDDLNPEDTRMAVGLCAELDRTSDALKIAYQGLRNHFDDARTHFAFIGLFLRHGSIEGLPAGDPTEVRNGTVVTYTIDDVSHSELVDDEDGPPCLLSSLPALSALLIGHRVGDDVVLRDHPIRKVSARIDAIVDKYVWTFNDCIKRFQERFPDAEGIWSVPFDPGDPSVLERIVPDDSARVNQLRELYQRGQLTLSGLAHLRGVPDYRVYEGLVVGQLGGIIAYAPNSDALKGEAQSFQNASTVCLEATTLFALGYLEKLTALASCGKRICVCQSLLDDLRREIIEIGREGTGKQMSLVRIEGRVGILEVPPDEVLRRAELLRRLLSWLEGNAEIIPISVETREEMREVAQFLTPSAFGTLILAKQESAVILTEDLGLRAVATQFSGVAGSWSLPCLLSLEHESGAASDVTKLLVRYFALNYRFLPLSDDLLIQALELDAGEVGPHVSAILRVASDSNVRQHAVVEMIALTYRHVTMTGIDAFRRGAIMDACLRAIASRGRWPQDKAALLSSICRRFILLPVHLPSIENHIQTWERQRIL